MVSFHAGKTNLITDVTGLKVGHAQDERIKSGVTVITAASAMTAAVHVAGGAPGTRETDLLASDKLVERADALVLSGGSALGLDAAGGVANALRASGRGYNVRGQCVPIVPAAIIFDLHNGGDKNWQTNPYASLGAQALACADTSFELGSHGAGTGALSANLKGGVGSASLNISLAPNSSTLSALPKSLPPGSAKNHSITVGALAVVNPVGSVTVPGQANFWAAEAEIGSEFGGLGFATRPQTDPYRMPPAKPVARENTTLVVVATDAVMTVPQLQRMAVAAHDGFARAIYPAHTPFDGDLVFAISTAQAEEVVDPSASKEFPGLINEPTTQMALGHAAALCVSRAIAIGVYEAAARPGDILPTWQSLYGPNRSN